MAARSLTGILGRMNHRAVTVRAIERFALPNTCVACERPVGASDPDALVCGVCRSRLVPILGGCARCRQPLPPVGPCRYCTDWPEALEGVRSAVWLGDEASAMVHHLKYDGLTRLGRTMAAVLMMRVRRPHEAVIVPVPLARGRQRQRGFNQSQVIAEALAAGWSLPLAANVLARVRETRTQTQLDPEERAGNVMGAFRARASRAERSEAGRPTVILVDDVLTTGATLVAAAAALATAGWVSVQAVTFARARPFAERVAAA
jgi:ComF family protein